MSLKFCMFCVVPFQSVLAVSVMVMLDQWRNMKARADPDGKRKAANQNKLLHLFTCGALHRMCTFGIMLGVAQCGSQAGGGACGRRT